MHERLGEVVEASSAAFTVHCYQLDGAAPLGALVRTTAQEPIYGVVTNVATLPLDPGRQPVALGRDEPDQDAVYRNNPQLARLLHTQFQALVVGHESQGHVFQHLPPRPPAIHSFVQACSEEEMSAFARRLDFLPLLMAGPAASGPQADEVVAAFLRQAASANQDPDAFLASASRQLAALLSRDVLRLTTLLRRLRPL